MKRRSFGLYAGAALATAAGLRPRLATAQVAPDASLLKTTLTPFGAERAGNADGSIPAWTGGVTTLPPGLSPGQYVPELFPDEQPVVVINADNMADHAAMLSEGTMVMMKKYGFSIKVYPTHRTAAAPQGVYDAIANNVATAKLDPAGGRFGFIDAFGGLPFPIPDTSDPYVAGAQIVWNYNALWAGYAYKKSLQCWSVSSGQLSLAFKDRLEERFPYYIAKSLADFNGMLYQEVSPFTAPGNLAGQNIDVWAYTEPYQHPQAAWELLNGQGRVRRAPEIAFDTPSTQANGVCGYDEYYGFNGSLEKYDWKYLGKQEMYIPYNNNAVGGVDATKFFGANFADPNVVRWEKHRCWVVEATLHPGERNVLARRMFYIDEDTFAIGVGDAWDGNNNLYKTTHVYNTCQPQLPGLVYLNSVVHNLQTDDYVAVDGTFDGDPFIYFADFPSTDFDPQRMAANAQY
jgi:hypothetical protein